MLRAFCEEEKGGGCIGALVRNLWLIPKEESVCQDTDQAGKEVEHGSFLKFPTVKSVSLHRNCVQRKEASLVAERCF